ncbi:MAG: thiamine pyrophosphate-dependent enzyme [Salibacteraceae bacterium]|nr:thiamine pyrophosphate-dependent enzyme [Salibacteraceae bacterium]|tara:strand:+ start:16613 stop:19045 length:2433 start_codon:yes stop_codon:yes gene_type:complete
MAEQNETIEAVEAAVKTIPEEARKELLADFRLATLSRETSLLGRREVLTGKAKFGIFGDGKEIAQIALAKQWKNGDWRSGYYRDQTMMMAAGLLTVQQFFAQLYAHPSVEAEPASGGRQMNGHYASRFIDENGDWLPQTEMKNASADISPTASQMPRLLGLAYASKFYRNSPELKDKKNFSNNGNEVAFGTIGDASTSEGMFWEAMNAAAVLSVPMVMSVWDDGHGISVPKEFQTTKASISEALAGFQRQEGTNGFQIFNVKGWDYRNLCLTYDEAVRVARDEHVPVLVHVEEVTQPQGHSTSGSHERYKSADRLTWETEYDCIVQYRKWMIELGATNDEELDTIVKECKKEVRDAKKAAWAAFLFEIKAEQNTAVALIEATASASENKNFVQKLSSDLKAISEPERRDIFVAIRKTIRYIRKDSNPAKQSLINWYKTELSNNEHRYDSFLYNDSKGNALEVLPVEPNYESDNKVDGREILRDNFDKLLSKNPELVIFGEDAGRIGGVNQGLEGLQDKYGVHRVFDTGIRECTIIGQAIGLSMRGLRPIAEIQYLDYVHYAIQLISDDLATVQYRTKGGQRAPVIIRTRGHRLEGVWHSGSPMGMILGAVRGIHVCVPRNMTQAAGMYNTLMSAEEPAIVIESLNGYRLKENLPSNLGEFKTPLGIPEIIKEGSDITLVTYGSMVRMVEAATKEMTELGISAEVIDIQTLLPFDIDESIVESLKKTSRILFIDEDVPGGASAFMMQQVIENQGGYQYLDAKPITLTAKAHRPAYGSDGDYFSKPSIEDIVEAAYKIMSESNPNNFPAIHA